MSINHQAMSQLQSLNINRPASGKLGHLQSGIQVADIEIKAAPPRGRPEIVVESVHLQDSSDKEAKTIEIVDRKRVRNSAVDK